MKHLLFATAAFWYASAGLHILSENDGQHFIRMHGAMMCFGFAAILHALENKS